MTDNKKEYWKVQNAKRVNVGISRVLVDKFREIRKQVGFRNDDQMIEYLLEIEKDLRDQGGIVEYNACEECGAPIAEKLDSCAGITHWNIDAKSNCFGHITTKYRANTKIEVPPSPIETYPDMTIQKEKIEVLPSPIETKTIETKTIETKKEKAMDEIDDFDRISKKEIKDMSDKEFDAYNTRKMLESGLVD